MAKKKETPEEAPKPKKLLPSEINADGAAWEYAQPDSTLELGGAVFKLGSPCSGWTPKQLDKYRHSIRPRKVSHV